MTLIAIFTGPYFKQNVRKTNNSKSKCQNMWLHTAWVALHRLLLGPDPSAWVCSSHCGIPAVLLAHKGASLQRPEKSVRRPHQPWLLWTPYALLWIFEDPGGKSVKNTRFIARETVSPELCMCGGWRSTAIWICIPVPVSPSSLAWWTGI